MLTPFVPGRPAREADAALKSAAQAEAAARRCAVLWFGEILARELFRDLGYSSMPQYARVELGFSETRISDFMAIARKLDDLPAIKEALPEIGYTKVRDIVTVASPRTEDRWVEAAKACSRQQLAAEVKRVRAVARRPRGEVGLFAVGEEAAGAGAEAGRLGLRDLGPRVPRDLGPGDLRDLGPGDLRELSPRDLRELAPRDLRELAVEVPVRVGVEFTPEQHARWEALWETLRKRHCRGSRAEVLLDALAALVAATDGARGASADTAPTATPARFPRGKSDPPIQINVQQCDSCGRVEAGGRALGRADAARVQCDAAVSVPGRRNTTTIPPRIRREVLARDRYRCRAPGCGHRRFLEVHHVTPRSAGGTNVTANLITLCGSCHRLWHERRLPAPAAGDEAPG